MALKGNGRERERERRGREKSLDAIEMESCYQRGREFAELKQSDATAACLSDGVSLICF